jgi:hypothetical protein
VGSVESPAWQVAVTSSAGLREQEGLVPWRVAEVLTTLSVKVMAPVGRLTAEEWLPRRSGVGAPMVEGAVSLTLVSKSLAEM